MRIQQRQAHRTRSLGHPLFALSRLVEVKRRGIDHRQHLRAGCLGRLRRLVEPGVFANQNADLDTTHLEHQRSVAGIAARGEIAPLVEDLVVRQLALAVGADDASPCQQRGRIEAQRHGGGRGPNIAAIAELMRMPDQHMQALTRCQLSRDAGQRFNAALHEGRAQQQVLRRVAAQCQLRRHQQLSARSVRSTCSFDNALGVARQVADGRVDLSQRKLDHVGAC